MFLLLLLAFALARPGYSSPEDACPSSLEGASPAPDPGGAEAGTDDRTGKVAVIFYPGRAQWPGHGEIAVNGRMYKLKFLIERQRFTLRQAQTNSRARLWEPFWKFTLRSDERHANDLQTYLDSRLGEPVLFLCSGETYLALRKWKLTPWMPFPIWAIPSLHSLYLGVRRARGDARISRVEYFGRHPAFTLSSWGVWSETALIGTAFWYARIALKTWLP